MAQGARGASTSCLARRSTPRSPACYPAPTPECLWPWAAAHIEWVLYFVPTRAHNPVQSAYHFTHPDAGEADLSWAKPLFCDVAVHLSERDIKTKTGPTGADGCFLGHDFIRGGEFVYVPSLRRLSSYAVTTWRTSSFEICKQITAAPTGAARQSSYTSLLTARASAAGAAAST